MSSYKVLQDIEAEDKLLGPLTLRQFIYAAIAVVSAFLAFKLGTKNPILIAPFLPIIVLFGILAAPFGTDQPNEVWLLAKVRFFLKPRLKIWNQAGVLNLVEITAPKVLQRDLSKNLSQDEVRTRLENLAATIDSHGWSVKNVNLTSNPSYYAERDQSDRLVSASDLPKEVPAVSVAAADDMMDPVNNRQAQQLDQMVTASDQAHKQKVIEDFSKSTSSGSSPSAPANNWFATQPTNPIAQPATGSINYPVAPIAQGIPSSLNSGVPFTPTSNNGVANQAFNPYGQPNQIQPTQPTTPMTTSTDPAILGLALANNDNWSVATQAHQAEEAKMKQPPEDEVVISLH
jgi:hypothetical protein